MLQVALELVKKEMEEALTQEANVGKKTIIWKVRQSCGFRDLQANNVSRSSITFNSLPLVFQLIIPSRKA